MKVEIDVAQFLTDFSTWFRGWVLAQHKLKWNEATMGTIALILNAGYKTGDTFTKAELLERIESQHSLTPAPKVLDEALTRLTRSGVLRQLGSHFTLTGE